MRHLAPSTQKVNVWVSLKHILGNMKRHLALICFAFFLASFGALLTIIGPDIIGKITDLMAEGLYGPIDLHSIIRVGLILIAIYVASSLSTFFQNFIMSSITLESSRNLRQDVSQKINKLPLNYFSQISQGDILSRVTNDVSTLQSGLSTALPGIISAVTQLVGCIIMMFVTQWCLALCVIAVTFLGLFVMMMVMKSSQRFFFARQKSLGALNGYIEEMYSGHEIVRVSRAEDDVLNCFNELNKQVYESTYKSQFLSGVMQPLMNIVGNFGYVVVCVIGSILALQGTITFGVIVSFIFYVRLFSAPLTQIAQGMANLQSASAASERIFEFLDLEEISNEGIFSLSACDIQGQVEFSHIHFSYPSNPDTIVINDLSARVYPGEKVAIVGPTGAGKTTLVQLLMRFYELKDGEIRIDGVPITDIPRQELHSLFAMVLQDTWLFKGTVRQNLVYNMRDITDEQIMDVCEACGIAHFVRSLPGGLDAELSDETTISAGQKQLFTIARAMLQDSPMLILDEATSSVDTRTEHIIQQAMDSLMVGRTSFVIAHRLSTIKNADLILVVEHGDIVESGTHEELMLKRGHYFNLYNSQFESCG